MPEQRGMSMKRALERLALLLVGVGVGVAGHALLSPSATRGEPEPDIAEMQSRVDDLTKSVQMLRALDMERSGELADRERTLEKRRRELQRMEHEFAMVDEAYNRLKASYEKLEAINKRLMDDRKGK
jgi:hypothetical protein